MPNRTTYFADSRRLFLRASAAVACCPQSLWSQQAGVDDGLFPPSTRFAVERGLQFLAGQQNEDGSFGGGGYGRNVAVCGLAAMAMLAGGSTPGRGPFGGPLRLCVDYIARSCRRNGFIVEPEAASSGPMYGHGFATLFLAEVYGMSLRGGLRERLRKAVQLIVRTQNDAGGWRYQPIKSEADLSVTVCQMMALRAARNAGFYVPNETIERATEYVLSCQNDDGGFCYQAEVGGPSEFPRTAAAIVALNGAGLYEGKAIDRGLQYLSAHPPRSNRNRKQRYFLYGHYYAAQAFWQVGGERWADWYSAIRDVLVPVQEEDGSWFDESISFEFGTAMSCLILQMPRNHLPIFSPMTSRLRSALTAMLCSLLPGAHSAGQTVALHELGKPPVNARLESISADWECDFLSAGARRTVAARDLAHWGAARIQQLTGLVVLADGSIIAGDLVRVSGGSLSIANRLLGEIVVVEEDVSGILFRRCGPRTTAEALDWIQQSEEDRVLLANGDVITGAIRLAAGDEAGTFFVRVAAAGGMEPISIDVATVAALAFAGLEVVASDRGLEVGLRDGTRLQVAQLQKVTVKPGKSNLPAAVSWPSRRNCGEMSSGFSRADSAVVSISAISLRWRTGRSRFSTPAMTGAVTGLFSASGSSWAGGRGRRELAWHRQRRWCSRCLIPRCPSRPSWPSMIGRRGRGVSCFGFSLRKEWRTPLRGGRYTRVRLSVGAGRRCRSRSRWSLRCGWR